MGLMIGYAVLFTAVTRPRDLCEALVWILKPIPFLPERRIGLMVSLTLRFFSRIMDQVDEVRAAHLARLGDRNHNPFRKAKFMALPILRRSILDVEEVTFALVARGYQENLNLPSRLSKIPLLHLIPVILMAGVMLLSLWMGEGAMGPAPAAIANAIFQAAGIRLRKIPFTPERVREALNLG